jgi:excisionase family DNA binding protein
VEPVLLKTEQAARMLSLGRTKIYELIAAGELPVVRIGRCVRISTVALQEWVDLQVARAAEAMPRAPEAP